MEASYSFRTQNLHQISYAVKCAQNLHQFCCMCCQVLFNTWFWEIGAI